MHDGDFASVLIDSTEHCLNMRGINMVVVCPYTLQVKDARNFNTLDDASAARNLINYVASIPQHHHVLCAARTDATSRMTPDAVLALQSIGAHSFTPGFGGSWALQGRKGGNREACRQACRTRLGGCAAIMNVLTQLPMRSVSMPTMDKMDKSESSASEAEHSIEEAQLTVDREKIGKELAATSGEGCLVLEHALEGRVKVLRKRGSGGSTPGGCVSSGEKKTTTVFRGTAEVTHGQMCRALIFRRT